MGPLPARPRVLQRRREHTLKFLSSSTCQRLVDRKRLSGKRLRGAGRWAVLRRGRGEDVEALRQRSGVRIWWIRSTSTLWQGLGGCLPAPQRPGPPFGPEGCRNGNLLSILLVSAIKQHVKIILRPSRSRNEDSALLATKMARTSRQLSPKTSRPRSLCYHLIFTSIADSLLGVREWPV